MVRHNLMLLIIANPVSSDCSLRDAHKKVLLSHMQTAVLGRGGRRNPTVKASFQKRR
jgi:hypothetical protein